MIQECSSVGGLAEGVFTAPVLLEMARERDVDMPIAAAVAALLDGTVTVDAAISVACPLCTSPIFSNCVGPASIAIERRGTGPAQK